MVKPSTLVDLKALMMMDEKGHTRNSRKITNTMILTQNHGSM